MSGLEWLFVAALCGVAVAAVAAVRIWLAERRSRASRMTSRRDTRMTAVPSRHPFEQPIVGSRDRRLPGKRRRRARKLQRRIR